MRPMTPQFRLPRRLRVPFAGRAFLLVTLGVGVAAVNTGNNLLYLALSLNLSLILLSGVLSEGTLRRIRLSVRLASEAFAGGEAFLAVTGSAEAKRFPGISLIAILRAGGEPVTVRFPDIGPGTSATRVVPFRPFRRGALDSIHVSISTRFPFSLFEKSVELSVPAGILVYPRPSPPGTGIGNPQEAAPSGRTFRADRGVRTPGERGSTYRRTPFGTSTGRRRHGRDTGWSRNGKGRPLPWSTFMWRTPARRRRSKHVFRMLAGRCSRSSGATSRSG